MQKSGEIISELLDNDLQSIKYGRKEIALWNPS
jgi:hypothetical protein